VFLCLKWMPIQSIIQKNMNLSTRSKSFKVWKGVLKMVSHHHPYVFLKITFGPFLFHHRCGHKVDDVKYGS
jgi:hypothetical protein